MISSRAGGRPDLFQLRMFIVILDEGELDRISLLRRQPRRIYHSSHFGSLLAHLNASLKPLWFATVPKILTLGGECGSV